jgi:hypothetical protein
MSMRYAIGVARLSTTANPISLSGIAPLPSGSILVREN